MMHNAGRDPGLGRNAGQAGIGESDLVDRSDGRIDQLASPDFLHAELWQAFPLAPFIASILAGRASSLRMPSHPEVGHIADFILVDQSKKTLGLGAKAAYRDAVGEIRHR